MEVRVNRLSDTVSETVEPLVNCFIRFSQWNSGSESELFYPMLSVEQ